MKGLLFNLIAQMAERAGCADQAWELALSKQAQLAGDAADGGPRPGAPPQRPARDPYFRLFLATERREPPKPS